MCSVSGDDYPTCSSASGISSRNCMSCGSSGVNPSHWAAFPSKMLISSFRGFPLPRIRAHCTLKLIMAASMILSLSFFSGTNSSSESWLAMLKLMSSESFQVLARSRPIS